jgi:hypothetical protein
MKNRIIIYLRLVVLFAFYANVDAIQVSGDTWGTWDPSNNPYEVIGNLRVPRDSSLTILPGCSIQFMGHYKMQIDSLAKLIAVGTASDSIYFFPIDTVEGWAGVKLYYSDSTSRFSYCSFKYGRRMGTDTSNAIIDYRAAAINIDNCYFYRNQGGVICGLNEYSWDTYTCKAIITSSKFIENNPASGTDGWGGVIEIDFNNTTISNCIFRYNRAGVIMCWGQSIIANNIINDNMGIPVGQYWGNSFIVDHNVICHNTSDWIMPSAIMAQEVFGPVIITNNTMCNNVNGSDMYNGVCAIWNEHTGTTAYLTNNILWGDSSVPLIRNDGNCTININYSDIRGGYSGTGNIDLDPLFVDTANGDYRLRWDSPCIDAGDPASPLDPNGTRADMGALPPYIPEFTLYLPGDISGDWQRLGADVTYGVRYFKGLSSPPPDSLYNDSTGTWLYAAADVNGDCEFRGADITYLVGYFKGINPVLKWCPQTPPF